MLRVESRVPIDLWKIKAENAILTSGFNLHVWIARKKLVAESAVITLVAHFVRFVNDSADCSIFVKQYVGDEGFVGKVL